MSYWERMPWELKFWEFGNMGFVNSGLGICGFATAASFVWHKE